MALTLPPKAPGEVLDYPWTPGEDGIASYTASVSGATLDSSESNGDTVTVFVSGGTAGTVATITLAAVSNEGRTYNETIYLPIHATTVAGGTARDVVEYALRKVTGPSTPSANEADYAMETLRDMVRAWADEGADIGLAEPLELATVLTCRNSDLEALKANLTTRLAYRYGTELDPFVVQAARRGLQRIKARNLPAVREGAEFY